MLEELGLSDQTCSRDIITIHDNYKGPGYGRNESADFGSSLTGLSLSLSLQSLAGLELHAD